MGRQPKRDVSCVSLLFVDVFVKSFSALVLHFLQMLLALTLFGILQAFRTQQLYIRKSLYLSLITELLSSFHSEVSNPQTRTVS